jgi:hypothetical protein
VDHFRRIGLTSHRELPERPFSNRPTRTHPPCLHLQRICKQESPHSTHSEIRLEAVGRIPGGMADDPERVQPKRNLLSLLSSRAYQELALYSLF